MPDMGTMQDHIDDLMQSRDHYRRALRYVCEVIANTWSDKQADDIFDDAMWETANG